METITTDLCELDFPPEIYGGNPSEVEEAVQAVIERVFRDEDGIVRSGVYGKTMKPLRLEEVADRPYGIGCFSQNHAMPHELKPIYNNYENAGQASGKYIRALLNKHQVTGDSQSVELARRTFQALELLWNNAAKWVPGWCFRPDINPYGRGWIPKPFAGIRRVEGMTECSPDQYTDITLGLERFYREVAGPAEREIIEAMVCSFADWWFRHDYTTTYEGGCSWWKMRPDCIHVIAFFLYLNALAQTFKPAEQYERGFEVWLNLLEGGYEARSHWGGPNAVGLTMQCLDRLMELRPEYKERCMDVFKAANDHLLKRVQADKDSIPGIKGLFQFKHSGAWYLCDAHRVLGDDSVLSLAEEFLSAYSKRVDFYHISRGVPVDSLAPVIAGDDYRNMFVSEGHICWLGAYWYAKGERDGPPTVK